MKGVLSVKTEKVLILGATGMLGHTLFKYFFKMDGFDVHATARSLEGFSRWFVSEQLERIIENVNADNFDSVECVINDIRPDVVINCIGIIKQLPEGDDAVKTITINALFPHKGTHFFKNFDKPIWAMT